MKLSRFQEPILAHALAKKSHLLVNAKAGAGKTTTLRILAERILQQDPQAKVCFLAFNRSIKMDAERKFPAAVEVKTCHAMGLKTIKSINSKVEVDNSKVRKFVEKYAEEKGWFDTQDAEELKAASEKVKRFMRLCDLLRQVLSQDVEEVAFRYGIDMAPSECPDVLEIVRRISNYRAVIDTTDMIYRPAVFNHYRFDKYDYVLIDECQDLSVAQQRFVQKLVKEDGIMVFVGDPCQAIYGFAGADAESFNKIREIKGITELPLLECYRCGKDIITYVQTIEPDIVAFDKNGSGEVDEEASVEDLLSGDLVLCRLTLPLVVLCYKLIGEGKKAYIKGKDVGKQLTGLIKKSKTRQVTGLTKWLSGYLSKTEYRLKMMFPHETVQEIRERRSYVMAEEMVSIINTVAASDPMLNSCDQLIAKISSLFDSAEEGVCLSTIHKAKGLEADRVYILERELMPSRYAKKEWELVQERNLEYVAYTRAIKYLGFINDWSSDGQDVATYGTSTQEAADKVVAPPHVENLSQLF